MSYRIEGDGSWNHTKVWRDGKLVSDWHRCIIRVSDHQCCSSVDGVEGKLDRIVLLGIYRFIGDGDFSNTNIFVGDELLRGVQCVTIVIERGKHTITNIDAIFLPNIVEGEECLKK